MIDHDDLVTDDAPLTISTLAVLLAVGIAAWLIIAAIVWAVAKVVWP